MQLLMDEAELRQLPISIDPEVMSGVPVFRGTRCDRGANAGRAASPFGRLLGAWAAACERFRSPQQMTEDRRAHPTEDLASAIATGRIAGAPLGDFQTIGYYTIVATVLPGTAS